MHRFFVEISDVAWERLGNLAFKQHRDPQQQGAVLIEQVLMAEGQITIEHTPRLTELSNGAGLAMQETSAE